MITKNMFGIITAENWRERSPIPESISRGVRNIRRALRLSESTFLKQVNSPIPLLAAVHHLIYNHRYSSVKNSLQIYHNVPIKLRVAHKFRRSISVFLRARGRVCKLRPLQLEFTIYKRYNWVKPEKSVTRPLHKIVMMWQVNPSTLISWRTQDTIIIIMKKVV